MEGRGGEAHGRTTTKGWEKRRRAWLGQGGGGAGGSGRGREGGTLRHHCRGPLCRHFRPIPQQEEERKSPAAQCRRARNGTVVHGGAKEHCMPSWLCRRPPRGTGQEKC